MESKRVRDRERRLERYFDSASRAQDWDALYDADSLDGVIHRDRQTLALGWIDDLALPTGASALDVGCGPGRTALALADRGFRVIAIDTSPEMRALALARAGRAGVRERIAVQSGQAEDLSFQSGSFDLLIALGVLPYLPDPQRALHEFARVLRPGGSLVLSTDNRLRLNRLVDPRFSPLAAPLRDRIKAMRERRGSAPLEMTMPASLAGATNLLSLDDLTTMTTVAGMTRERAAGIGYAPLTFMGRVLFPGRSAVRIHRCVQGAGSRGVPLIRSIALQHLVLARVR